MDTSVRSTLDDGNKEVIVFLLLIVVAILLFGSSAILGAAGWVLGFVALVAVLAYASVQLQMPVEEVFGAGFLLLVAALFGLKLYLYFLQRPLSPRRFARIERDQYYRWEKKAARGDAMAQKALGHLYHMGQGVPKDNVLAHVWFSRAALQGYKDADKNRDNVAKEMTSDQLAEARRMARKGTPSGR